VKFSDNPGRDVSQLMVDTIRKNGYQGGIEIYFYELPKSSLPSSASPDTDRYYGTAIRLTRTYDAGFAKNFGASTWPVSSTLASVSHAYSDGKIWRPTGNSNGRYTSTSGNTIIYEQISMDKYPNELIEKLKLK
ncbi:MAG: hypothetical protein RR672_10185, partial [Raoultibacter sp.]